MDIKSKWDILIIGGGLAGLTTALHLAHHGKRICLIEKNPYPQHKVCGEYVSNEVLPYLNSLDIHPFSVGAKKIDTLEISNERGRSLQTELPLGGFGISRFAFDSLLYHSLKDRATVIFDTVEEVKFDKDHFVVRTKKAEETYLSHFVIGAFGKRSNLDISLKRNFITRKSPWLAIKNHYEYEDLPENVVALHNFKGGYCGLSKIENGEVNACYLATFKSFRASGDIETFQNRILSQNPYLNEFFATAKPAFEKPLTISQISFDEKQPVENHIFMVGDSAGLIHPLCGNGMAMAIRSAQIFSELFLAMYETAKMDRAGIEKEYTALWKREFGKRLKTGRYIQKILIHPLTSSIGFAAARRVPSLLPNIIQKTHGSPRK